MSRSHSIVHVNDSQGAAATTGSRLSWSSVVRITWVGIAAAVAGVITGLVMALQRRVVVCADGTFFPEGTTDFRCFEHPLVLVGAAVAAISIALGVLIVLVVAAMSGVSQSERSPTE